MLPDELKPAGHQYPFDYLTAYNDAPLHVGDVIATACQADQRATILAIWFTISPSGPHMPVSKTEIGHKHIIRLDRSLGDVPEDKAIDVTVAHRND